MELSPERAGPYVRALRAALDTLAPNEDHVPLSAALDHLAALDPALSGTVLLPAEVGAHSGMPEFSWLERARAEAVVAVAHGLAGDPSDVDLDRARALDRALGDRMASRRAVMRHLRAAELLPVTRLTGVVRRRSEDAAQVALAYDRMSPDGRWVRVRVEVALPSAATRAVSVDPDGHLTIDERLQHLFTRHFSTSTPSLWANLETALGGTLVRFSRGWLGPFWFPGVVLPDGVPAELGLGLLLHATTEIVARDIRRSRHLDPLEPDPMDRLPAGFGVVRERRFAAAGRALAVGNLLRNAGGTPVSVTPIVPPR